MIISLLTVFVLLALLGLPIAIVGGVASAISLHFFSDLPNSLLLLIQRMSSGVYSYTILSVPLFILCGNLMNTSGITNRIFFFAQSLVGHVSGGLAQANVIASIIFSGMTGSAVADAGGLGQIEIKAMEDQGYEKDFSVAVTAATSTIGPIIPPSVPMIIYATISEVSIGKLFLAGIIPGIFMGIAFMVMIFFISKRRNFPKSNRLDISTVWLAFKRALFPLLTPGIILGGLFFGIFTVTEAAAVACLYAFLLGSFYKEVKIRDLPGIIISTMKTTGVIMFILSTIAGVSWILVYMNVGQIVGNFIFSITENPILILLMINVFLLLIGCVLEVIPVLVLFVPVFLPIITTVGINPIHFGVVMVFNLMIGLITPPVGMVLFVLSDIGNLPLERLIKSIIPFLVPLIIVLFIITLFPDLVLFIPNLFM